MLLKGRYRAYRNNLPVYSPDKDRIADEYRKIAQHTRLVKITSGILFQILIPES
nr:Uncharacterised protein [Klebsiella pneumoniae]